MKLIRGYIRVGLSLLFSKNCPLFFLEFPKIFSHDSFDFILLFSLYSHKCIINYACTHSNRQTINYACTHSNRQTINYACTHSNRQTINYACTHSNRQTINYACTHSNRQTINYVCTHSNRQTIVVELINNAGKAHSTLWGPEHAPPPEILKIYIALG